VPANIHPLAEAAGVGDTYLTPNREESCCGNGKRQIRGQSRYPRFPMTRGRSHCTQSPRCNTFLGQMIRLLHNWVAGVVLLAVCLAFASPAAAGAPSAGAAVCGPGGLSLPDLALRERATREDFVWTLMRLPGVAAGLGLPGWLSGGSGSPLRSLAYEDAAKALEQRGLLDRQFTGRPGQKLTRGDAALPFARFLGLRGGASGRSFGLGRRVAYRQLADLGLMPSGGERASMTGAELILRGAHPGRRDRPRSERGGQRAPARGRRSRLPHRRRSPPVRLRDGRERRNRRDPSGAGAALRHLVRRAGGRRPAALRRRLLPRGHPPGRHERRCGFPDRPLAHRGRGGGCWS
jgi:hypothetical protein